MRESLVIDKGASATTISSKTESRKTTNAYEGLEDKIF